MTDKLTMVSVIVPCFNQGHYIHECLDSLRKQWWTNWECIVVDDGSSDNTREVVRPFTDQDSRIKYVHQSNKGLSGARNTGLRNAKGEFLVFLDSDDALVPSALSKFLKRFQENNNLRLVFSGYVGTREDLTSIIKTTIPRFVPGQSFYEGLCLSNMFPVHAAMVKANVLNDIGDFDEQLRSCEDWDLWLRLGRISNDIDVIAEPLAIYRMTKGSMSRTVEPFFQAGLIVLERTINTDPRVTSKVQLYPAGFSGNYRIGLKNWYSKCIALHLSQQNSDGAHRLATELFNKGEGLDKGDIMKVWHNMLSASLMNDARVPAWKMYRPTVLAFLNSLVSTIIRRDVCEAVIRDLDKVNASTVSKILYRLKLRA